MWHIHCCNPLFGHAQIKNMKLSSPLPTMDRVFFNLRLECGVPPQDRTTPLILHLLEETVYTDLDCPVESIQVSPDRKQANIKERKKNYMVIHVAFGSNYQPQSRSQACRVLCSS